jgi:uncharacterized membrane protein
MKRFEERISVGAPADKIFAYVSDFQRHGEWASNDLEATKVGDGPVAVGTKYATTAKQFGTQREESTITDLSAPTTFAWDSKGALGLAHHWFTLSDQGGTTTVVKGVELVEPTFLAKLTGFKLNKDLPSHLRSDLVKIKATMEGSAG